MALRVLKPETFGVRGDIGNHHTTLFAAVFFCLFLDLGATGPHTVNC